MRPWLANVQIWQTRRTYRKYSYFCAPVREITNHYRLYHLQILADLIREDTCDTRRSMPACATTRGHRAMAPAGAGGRGVPLTYRALAPAGAGDSRVPLTYRALAPAGADGRRMPLTYRALAPAGAGGCRVPFSYRALAPAGADNSGSRPTANY